MRFVDGWMGHSCEAWSSAILDVTTQYWSSFGTGC